MALERLILTPERITQAEKSGFKDHPIIGVLDKNLPRIIPITIAHSQITDGQEQQMQIKKDFGFLADAIADCGQFELNPKDMIAVWSSAMDIPFFSTYHRRFLARAVTSACAIQGIENLEWKKVPRHFLETGQLPEEVIGDESGLHHVKNGLNRIGNNLDFIHSAFDGSLENQYPVLREVYENFGNGYGIFATRVRRALRVATNRPRTI